ncbi:Amino acid ABC transporter binding protein and permease protein [Labilithrix luteola]|uniref:Amino acid ABC transporter binding protein and permease protein n=1 Tax=Labilithrix luteola TaxID=1391654 RepID=A0A0K1QBV7_9BACT|nr:ABC transporter substrate-binding protein/permease [Labilithrix luteola]AKV03261.1 Amino acid ABC transporter binding protein and permease protein [Labilithrix luteola]
MNGRCSSSSRWTTYAFASVRADNQATHPARTKSRWLVALFAIAIALVACGHQTSTPVTGLARIRAAGVLRWGGDIQGGEPYVYDDPKHPGHLVGFEVDLAEALGRELGVRTEFVQNDWANLVPSLERGTFDVIMNGLEITDARAGRILFTRPYYVFAERLMARKSDRSIAPALPSLEGRKVGTLANSLAFDILRGHADTVVYEGVEEPYTDLQRGRVDAVLLDDIIATRYGVPKEDLHVVGDLRDGFYAIGVRQNEPDVKEAVDAALERIAARGELHRILEKSQLWNDRQTRLEHWSSEGSAKLTNPAPAPATFGVGHALLFLKGASITLFVSVLAMAIAIPLGLALSIARLFGGAAARRLAGAYVEIYRGTPVLLQLYFLYYGLAPVLRLGALPAAILGLGMNYAAYEAEVYRAGFAAVPKAQMEAALSLGMSTPLALRRIVLPQAFRHAIPNVTNDFIALLKDSSLVSVITVVELTKQMSITAIDVRSWVVPGLACAALYFAMSYPLGVLARRLERKLEGEHEMAAEIEAGPAARAAA